MNEDALVKVGLEALLRPFVTIHTQHEVQPPAQYVDAFVASDASDPQKIWDALGWLGKMASSFAMLEAFTRPVSERSARDCVRKQLTLHHVLELQASAQQKQGELPVEVPVPTLWMLSWGQPRALLSSWGMATMQGWPAGFYQAAPGWRVAIVVLHELPRTRETLPLRLFGDERVRRGLREELDHLPNQDPMVQVVTGMLVHWSLWVRGQPQDEALKRWLMDFEQVVQNELRKLVAEGKAEGEAKGLRTAVEDLCELLEISLTGAQRAHLEKIDLNGLEALRRHLKQHRAWPADVAR